MIKLNRTKKNNPIIVALDLDDSQSAFNLIDKLEDRVSFYKVGMQLFFKEGPLFLKKLKNVTRKKVFLDLKINDIPNTIQKAIKSLRTLQPELMTVFTEESGVRAAVEAAEGNIKILNVTVLTSQPQENQTIDRALRRTELSLKNGADGIVCSGHETAQIRKEFGENFIIVNPGIRMHSEKDDQKRVVTPIQAIQNGASYLVIGRPITQATDPIYATEEILNSLKLV